MHLSKFNHQLLKQEYENNVRNLRRNNHKIKKENDNLNYLILTEIVFFLLTISLGLKLIPLSILLAFIPTTIKRLYNRKNINNNKLEIKKNKRLIEVEDYYIKESENQDIVYLNNNIIEPKNDVKVTSNFLIKIKK